MLITVESVGGSLKRKFTNLELEREKVIFFPLTWTVVHPITETSPFYGLDRAELEHLQAEVLVMIKAFDESFSQSVNARYSYPYDQIIWEAKFKPAFEVAEDGGMLVDVGKVGDFQA